MLFLVISSSPRLGLKAGRIETKTKGSVGWRWGQMARDWTSFLGSPSYSGWDVKKEL